MQVDLVKLLQMREIAHPSKIVGWASTGDASLRIELSGFPWWSLNRTPGAEGRITLHLEGIAEGALYGDLFASDPFHEDLELLDVRPLSEHAWASGASCEVFCSGALADPLSIYVRLHDFLVSVECPYGPERYLNMGQSGSLGEFASITSSAPFLLVRGPDGVTRIVCDALDQCEANYSVVRGKDVSLDKICFQLAGSHLICRSAYAVFDE